MNGQLRMFGLETSMGTHSVTSSPASGAGPAPSSLRAGRKTARSGRVAAPASRSAWQDAERERLTSATCGPLFATLSPSAALQSALASRLVQRLAAYGSPEYALTWKSWDMASGPPICAVRASGRRTSGNASTGWPTPDSYPRGGAQDPAKRKAGGHSVTLQDAATLAGWPTPRAEDSEQTGGHRGNPDTLTSATKLAGWPTPDASAMNDGEGLAPWQARAEAPFVAGLEGHAGHVDYSDEPGRLDEDTGGYAAPAGPSGLGEWADSDFIRCSDGKERRVPLEPALFPLAARLPNRVGILRGAGNAITAPLAAEFVSAYMETQP